MRTSWYWMGMGMAGFAIKNATTSNTANRNVKVRTVLNETLTHSM